MTAKISGGNLAVARHVTARFQRLGVTGLDVIANLVAAADGDREARRRLPSAGHRALARVARQDRWRGSTLGIAFGVPDIESATESEWPELLDAIQAAMDVADAATEWVAVPRKPAKRRAKGAK